MVLIAHRVAQFRRAGLNATKDWATRRPPRREGIHDCTLRNLRQRCEKTCGWTIMAEEHTISSPRFYLGLFVSRLANILSTSEGYRYRFLTELPFQADFLPLHQRQRHDRPIPSPAIPEMNGPPKLQPSVLQQLQSMRTMITEKYFPAIDGSVWLDDRNRPKNVTLGMV